MSEEDYRPTKEGWAGAVLDLNPRSIKEALLTDFDFLAQTGIETTARIVLGRGACVAERPKFFSAIRQLYATGSPQLVQSEAGETWQLGLAESGSPASMVLKRGDTALKLAPILPFHSDREVRLGGVDNAQRLGLPKSVGEKLRKQVVDGPLSDPEYGAYLRVVEATGGAVARNLRTEIQQGTGSLQALVPPRREYYESLVGPVSPTTKRSEFASENFLQWHIAEFERTPDQRLKELLPGCLHSELVDALQKLQVTDEEFISVLKWANDSDDPISMGAAVELALKSYSHNPEILTLASSMVQALLEDDPELEDGRFAVLSGTFIFADGELARSGVLRGLPVFYRRICACLQSFQIRDAVIDCNAKPAAFVRWALDERRHFFWLQSYLDGLELPRWQPEFALPDQLKIEVLSRVKAILASRKAEEVPEPFQKWIAAENELDAALPFPQRFFPGPLEGEDLVIPVAPDSLEEEIESQLSVRPVTTRAFIALANGALVWRTSDKSVALTIEALEDLSGFLGSIESKGQLWATLHGLAKVAANTRNEPLAKAVRSAVFRHRQGFDQALGSVAALRILYVAGAAVGDLDKYIDWVGDAAERLSLDDLTPYEARVFQNDLEHWGLLHPRFVPRLARSRASLSAYLGTVTS